MKSLIKKNQLMITALAIMIAIAGYLQFAGENLEDEYYKCINSVETARRKIYQMREQLGEQLKISFDEWNTWYDMRRSVRKEYDIKNGTSEAGIISRRFYADR